jgi:hypothetical protein
MTKSKRAAYGQWANAEFGDAELGNSLRTDRLVSLARSAVDRPAGLVTEVVQGDAEREGAYRLLENDSVPAGEIAAAACRASARRAHQMPYVFVPVDKSSLALAEYEGLAEREVGSIGARDKKGTGLEVTSAVVLSPLGVPLGMFSQTYWARGARPAIHRKKRTIQDKETRHWLATMRAGLAQWRAINPQTRPWFQIDREGDFREMLEAAVDNSQYWLTVRAGQDRRTIGEEAKLLWDRLEQASVLGSYEQPVPGGSNRKERTAHIEIRTMPVTLDLLDRVTNKRRPVTLNAVLARESGTTPASEEPVEWLLLTTYPVSCLADAEAVVRGYAQRWRIEQFHRNWKSVCKVEETQLRHVAHIERWATILASVAMRILRLTYLARLHPNVPALEELSRSEVCALIVKQGAGKYPLDAEITIEQAVFWIAKMGGYVGKSSGGPPGATVIARGLSRLSEAAEMIVQVAEFTRKT